jgi:hypothetical protein
MKHDFLGRQDIPVEAVMPALAQQVTEIAVGVVLLITFWGVRNLIKRGDSCLLICMLAGFFAVLVESHAMGMFKFVYPPVGQNILYTGFGRPVPIFMGMEYSAFFGLANYFYLKSSISSQWSFKNFCIGIILLIIAETILEVVSINLGLWAYFDDQPFLVADFPIHVAVVVACMSMVFGAFSKVWFDSVTGARQFLLVLIGPAVLLGTFSVFAYPVTFGMESQGGIAAAQIGSVVAIIISCTLSYMVVRQLSTYRN